MSLSWQQEEKDSKVARLAFVEKSAKTGFQYIESKWKIQYMGQEKSL